MRSFEPGDVVKVRIATIDVSDAEPLGKIPARTLNEVMRRVADGLGLKSGA
jgi:hypothetical protein